MTAPRSSAFLALWNDIETSRIAEYDRWHTLEHVPERVWVPGFRSGTRYVSLTGVNARYYTHYELDDLACLGSPEYQSLVEQPTPWSASMRPSFRNFLRKTCVTQAEHGRGKGAGLLALRAVWPAPLEQQSLDGFCAALLAGGAESCAMRVQAGRVEQAGPQAISNVDAAPAGSEYIVLVHTSRPEDLERLHQTLDKLLASSLGAPLWKHRSFYQVCSSVGHDEVVQAQRPAPRLDLMPAAAEPIAR